MKFTIGQQIFFKMVREMGRKFPGTLKPDKELRLIVASGVVYAATTCRAGAALAIETKDGECIVPRRAFEDVLRTYNRERLLTIQVKGALTIGSFRMPVTGFVVTPSPPKKFEWFGPNPSAARAPRHCAP